VCYFRIMSTLDWDDLRYFLAAARAGSLAGAARSLRVEHSTVGRRLTHLEQVLGGAVVLRNPDGLQLTALGRRLLPSLEEAERAVATASTLATAERTRVRLAVPSGMSALLADKLPVLRARHPQLALELLSGSRIVDVRRGEADLALRIGAPTDPDIVVRPVGSVASALYGARHYLRGRHAKVDVEDLSGHEVIAFDPALTTVPAASWLEARCGDAEIVLRSREMTDALIAVASGLGLGVLPCFLGDEHPALVRLTPQPVALSRLALVYRREAKLRGPLRAVADFVAARMKDSAPRLLGR
jgi:DNA-binding transcriptional LysR family regulator